MHKLCIATISPLAAILARSQCNYLVWEVSNLNLHVQEEYPISRCIVQEQLSHLRSLPVEEHILRVWRGEYHGEGAFWGLRSEYSQESGIKIEVGVIIFQNWAAEIILQRNKTNIQTYKLSMFEGTYWLSRFKVWSKRSKHKFLQGVF